MLSVSSIRIYQAALDLSKDSLNLLYVQNRQDEAFSVSGCKNDSSGYKLTSVFEDSFRIRMPVNSMSVLSVFSSKCSLTILAYICAPDPIGPLRPGSVTKKSAISIVSLLIFASDSRICDRIQSFLA